MAAIANNQPIFQFEPHVQTGAQTLICPRPDKELPPAIALRKAGWGQVYFMLCPSPAPFCLPLHILPSEANPPQPRLHWLVTSCLLPYSQPGMGH